MKPFPKKYGFEISKCVTAVHKFELAYLFIPFKSIIPLLVIEWW
jgi:hypothetical protein